MKIKAILMALILTAVLAGCGDSGTAGQSSMSESSSTSTSASVSESSSISESSSVSESQSTSDDAMQKTLSLSELSEEQLGAFKAVSDMRVDEVKSGKLTLDELNGYHLDVLTKDYGSTGYQLTMQGCLWSGRTA